MTQIDPPTRGQQRWFGLLLLSVFAVLGTVVVWQAEAWGVARVLWGIGSALALVYYLVRPLQRPLYYGWMHLVFPIGWVVSHVALAVVYYGIVSPMGLVLRLFGRDKLQRRLDTQADSYWSKRTRSDDPGRYLHQS